MWTILECPLHYFSFLILDSTLRPDRKMTVNLGPDRFPLIYSSLSMGVIVITKIITWTRTTKISKKEILVTFHKSSGYFS